MRCRDRRRPRSGLVGLLFQSFVRALTTAPDKHGSVATGRVLDLAVKATPPDSCLASLIKDSQVSCPVQRGAGPIAARHRPQGSALGNRQTVGWTDASTLGRNPFC